MPVWYETAFGSIDIGLTTYEFDNTGTGSFEGSSRKYSLEEYSNRGWTSVELGGYVELPSTAPELFPEDERSDPPAKLLLAIDCPDTHFREGRVIETRTIEPDVYEFEETLSRRYAYGDVNIRPILVRTEPCEEEGYAQYPFMRVADGAQMLIRFDDVEIEGSTLMDVHFESFENMGLPESNLYHLERSNDGGPSVWVNKDYELITRVLDTDANSGWAANLRSPVATWIAQDVVVELVLWAILGAGEGEFDETWQKELLDDYGPPIYEYITDADSPTDLHTILVGDSADEAHYLINTIEKVVQDKHRVSPGLEGFIEKEATDYFLRGS